MSLKRLGRYLRGRKTCVQTFPWNSGLGNIDVVVDSDWGGCPKTRCSTSGGVILLGGHALKHWATTQSTVSLSSAEAEVKAVTKGCIEALYVKHLVDQQVPGGVGNIGIQAWTDSTGAKGMMHRLGPGKRAKHLEIQNLWVQQVVQNGLITMKKIRSDVNCADVLTKHVPRGVLDKIMGMIHMHFPEEMPMKAKEFDREWWSEQKTKTYGEVYLSPEDDSADFSGLDALQCAVSAYLCTQRGGV